MLTTPHFLLYLRHRGFEYFFKEVLKIVRLNAIFLWNYAIPAMLTTRFEVVSFRQC